MKGRIGLLLCVVLAGCGVSKDIYRAEVVKSQDLEAKVGDLSSRLRAELEHRKALETELRGKEGDLGECRSQLDQAGARSRDLDGRLTASSGREARLRADLDLCRQGRGATETDLEDARRELEAQKTARAEERTRLTTEIEGLRSQVATAQARVAVLEEQKEKAEREKREKLDEISRTYDGLLQGLKDEVEKGRVTISQLQGKLSVNMLDEILFASGSVAIKAGGRDVLKRLGELLAGVTDKAIVIEGHTDDVPISQELSKRFPSNWELSTARAASVVRYLQDEVGIPPERLSAVGFGPYRPVASNDTPEGRARNRRIEIKLVPLEAPLFASPEAVEGGETPAGAGESRH